MLCISIDHWFTLVNNKILIIYCEYNKILDIKYKTSEKESKTNYEARNYSESKEKLE